jgi:hypothetical protein
MIAIKSLIPQKRDAWIMLVGVVTVMLLIAGIAVGPLRAKIRDLDSDISSQEKKLAKNLRSLAPLVRKSVETEYQQYGLRIQKKGSTEEENSQMLAELDRLAGANKLTLLATKPQKPVPDHDFELYAVEIEVEAEMAAIMGFVYGIENSVQLLRIDRLVIDVKGGGAALVKAALTVSKIVTL